MLRFDVLGVAPLCADEDLGRPFCLSMEPPALSRLGEGLLTQELFWRRSSGTVNATLSDLGCGGMPSSANFSHVSVPAKPNRHSSNQQSDIECFLKQTKIIVVYESEIDYCI